MLVAFFESIKYVGHLLPLAFLRVFLGYYYLQQALHKFNSDYLVRPRVAEQIAEWLPASHAPEWYKFLINYLLPNWSALAFALMAFEFAIAISYILGYVVRPMGLIGVFLCVNMLFISGPAQEDFFKTLLAIHLIMAWVGAGRCLGFDYFFYKRRRGIWW